MLIVFKGIKEIWKYILGNIFFRVLYDKEYLNSKIFKSKYHGIGAIGWEWVISDFMGRFFLKTNIGVPFPISPKIKVINHNNIHFDIDDLNNFQGQGNYYQAIGSGHIYIGKGSWIGPNVGIITTNHSFSDLSKHLNGENIKIGESCWIGMNSVILPSVELGSNTIVGAGSIVTKSFINGNCVIAGNPAKIIKLL